MVILTNLLSIGEVAKMKKTTVKALRYYEKIGILIPAYINEETGYRYYTMEQMVLLDFILICVELGIPLKRFPSYLDEDGVLDIDLLLRDGTSVAQQEIARINRTADKLKHMSLHLEESDRLPVTGGTSVTRYFPERFLLMMPMEGLYPTQKQYITALTDLYFQMESERYTNLYCQGLLYLTQEGTRRCYTYNEVEKPKNPEQITVLSAGNFHCQCMSGGESPWLERVNAFITANGDKSCILLQERYVRHFSEEPFWEVQMM